MRITCSYCGGYLEDTDVNCPNCNAPNGNLKRNAYGMPTTIEGLKEWAVENDIPLSQLRFFIGYDMREPRAYGIYKDENGNFVVYKNKANGKRAVRYKGTDEAYAVNEIYQKIRTEIADEKLEQAERINQNLFQTVRQTVRHRAKSDDKTLRIVRIIFCVFITIFFLSFIFNAFSIFSTLNEVRKFEKSFYSNEGEDYFDDAGFFYNGEYYPYDSVDDDWPDDIDWDDSKFDSDGDSGSD